MNTTDDLAQKLLELERKLDRILEYVEKTLHVSCTHFDLYQKLGGRPYYPLNDKWALTHLNTGQAFYVNTEDRNVTPWIIMGGHWETNVENVMMSYISPGMTVIDVGAHMGYYTIKLGSKVGPMGRLHAFEPNPEVNAVCWENIKINGLFTHTTLYKFALGDFTAQSTLTRSNSNMASANLIGDQDADYSVCVDVKRIDDVIPSDRPIDLIKLDAEGYEKRILDGAIESLKRSPHCAIMIELGLERWERSAPLSNLVESCGGDRQIYAVQSDGTLRSISPVELRDFLLSCPFYENYLFVARKEDVEEKIAHLIKA
jgi:FkbM family methyltransferase